MKSHELILKVSRALSFSPNANTRPNFARAQRECSDRKSHLKNTLLGGSARRTRIEEQRSLEEAEVHRREAEVTQLMHELLERVRELHCRLLSGRRARGGTDGRRAGLRPGAQACARQRGARRELPGCALRRGPGRSVAFGIEGHVRTVAPGGSARPGRVGLGV